MARNAGDVVTVSARALMSWRAPSFIQGGSIPQRISRSRDAVRRRVRRAERRPSRCGARGHKPVAVVVGSHGVDPGLVDGVELGGQPGRIRGHREASAHDSIVPAKMYTLASTELRNAPYAPGPVRAWSTVLVGADHQPR